MSIVPAFQLGLGNAWVLILPYLLITYGLCYLIVSRKSTLFSWPPYNKKEKRVLPVIMAAPFVLAGIITDLGAIIMGWNLTSMIYPIMWVYFILYIIRSHLGVLSEEKINIEKFGREYKDYMKRVPRYFLIRGK